MSETTTERKSATRYGAVIVAAGMSTRMKQFKQLMKVGDLTFADRVVLNFRRAGVRDIVMVTGYQAALLEKSLCGKGVVFLRNEAYETSQMFDSAKLGLGYMMGRCDRVFFCPVDVPFFMDETLKLEMTREEKLVYPICHNRIGHPILFDASLIPDILAYEGGRGLKGALDSLTNTQTTCYLPVSDEGAVMDADTREDLQYLVDLQNARLMRAEVKVTLANTETFFGPGTVLLLKQIEAVGSVAGACERTHISYSKGWKIIRSAEKELGYQIVERQAGGKSGGAAAVTERGKQLVALYEELERRVSRHAEQEFCAIFSAGELFSKSSREDPGQRSK